MNTFNYRHNSHDHSTICFVPFVDMLYANKGQSMVKLEDGSWETIDVEEEFSQGCPFSPVFAGIVFNHILRKLDQLMMQRAEDRLRQCLQQRLSSDDNQGGIPIVMGYMDDINAIVHVQDAAFFVYHFKRLGLPLGAILNQEKTRVMTSTNDQKLTDLLREFNDPHLQSTGEDLLQMIQENSTKDGVPQEITDGIRVLGTAVGNPFYCRNFISKAMKKV